MSSAGKSYLTCLWPGLPELWYRGQLSALPAALAFAFAVNFLLVARFIYPEWLTPLLVKIACWLAMGSWVYSVLQAIRRLPQVVSPREVSDQPDQFCEAHIEYLRGHWSEAEALLVDCLKIEERDPPAVLMLAGVYRHTDRLDAAKNLLDQLERMENGDRWWMELRDERRRWQRFFDAKNASNEPEEGEEEASSEPIDDSENFSESESESETSPDSEINPDSERSVEAESPPEMESSDEDSLLADATDEAIAAEMAGVQDPPQARSA